MDEHPSAAFAMTRYYMQIFSRQLLFNVGRGAGSAEKEFDYTPCNEHSAGPRPTHLGI